MEIKTCKYKEVEDTLAQFKPELLDKHAIYQGAYIKDLLVGVVSYVEHQNHIYMCHAFVHPDHRGKGIYKLLWEYRNMKVKELGKPLIAHCNVSSLKHFLNNGFRIDNGLFKVVKDADN
jgi:predicted GNAT family acetyltransferase